MDFNEEEMLIPLRDMEESSNEETSENEGLQNGHAILRQPSYQPGISSSLPWLDVRVFYVRLSRCVIDGESMPEYLTLNHVPLSRDTLLEVNGVRTSIYSDGTSTQLKRDRMDRRSEEVTFVSTDSIRTTGNVKFEVFHKGVLVLSGTLELCYSNGFVGQSSKNSQVPSWVMSCESDVLSSTGFLKGNANGEAGLPSIEIYVAGCFNGSPIVLTKTLQVSTRRKQARKGMLESIPEYEATESPKDASSSLAMQAMQHAVYKPEEEEHCSIYPLMDYMDGEDGELSWFNAGVRVGVGIGLSICLGVGIGVGLIVRTYQGTTRNFRRRLL